MPDAPLAFHTWQLPAAHGIVAARIASLTEARQHGQIGHPAAGDIQSLRGAQASAYVEPRRSRLLFEH